MLRFETDYQEGCHPKILQRLRETNVEALTGYGCDIYCEKARTIIRNVCQAPNADVHFLVGGTQTNKTIIAHALRPWEGVISPVTGHINGHETGAVEASGHKIFPLPSHEAKISASQVEDLVRSYAENPTPEHEIAPKMVYLSQPTEQGTLYRLQELEAFRSICDQYGLYLFIDGARLGYGLASPENDVTLPDLARLCDVFYIGGTKVGAMFGEAVVIQAPSLKTNFRASIKQNGGMLAKGRYLGIQFEALLSDGLYEANGRHAVELADRIRHALRQKNIDFLSASPTNQLFPILTPEEVHALEEEVVFETWQTLPDGRIAIRLCTSWVTPPENVDALLEIFNKILAVRSE